MAGMMRAGSDAVAKRVPQSAAWAARTICGNPACSRRWRALLKDHRRPVFEGQWGCCFACVQAFVKNAVRRERGEAGFKDRESEHHHRLPLGLILLSQGWITASQLQHALAVQRRAGAGRIGRWLVRECGLDHACVTRALGMQWGCPVLPLDEFDPEAMALAVPKLLVETLDVVPVRVAAGRMLYLACGERLHAAAAFAIERMSGLKVENGLVDADHLNAARQRLLACEFVPTTFERVGDLDSLAGAVSAAVGRAQPRASRLVRVQQFYWLRLWLEEGAMRSVEGGIPRTTEDVADRIYTVGSGQ